MKLQTCLACAALVSLAGPAAAQPVYRCGNDYSRVPCSGGTPLDVDTRATPAAQAAEARRAADRERRLGDDMEKSRLRREAALKPARAASLSPAPKPPEKAASASLKPKKRAKAQIRVVDEKDFVARTPKESARR